MYDYSSEPRRVIFMIDSKSFYASVESVELGLNPLQSVLVVMSKQENTNGGLVLAASPMAKKLYGISNVMRQRDIPKGADIIYAEPRMNYYIEVNMQINDIFRQYCADEDLHPYSIDESILDMTESWHLKGKSPREVARKIQIQVREETGIYLTVGIGDNPTLAKIALDIEAKKAHSFIGEWHYEDVPDKLWPITELNEVWSIGRKTAEKFERWGIHSMYDLAHYNPYTLKKRLGKIGSQLFALSWGIDRSIVRESYIPKSKSYGNSQVLPRDYRTRAELKVVLREIAEQVAARIRKHHRQAGCVSLSIGLSYGEHEAGNHGFSKQMRITPTNKSVELNHYIQQIFEENWHGEAVRNIAVSYSKLVDDQAEQLNLFTDEKVSLKQRELDRTLDELRQRFGLKKLVKLSSLTKGGTAINRAGLVGGHRGGNAYE